MSSLKPKSTRPRLTSQQTQEKDQGPRGCRKLQFEAHKPLKGKSFYLDVRKQVTKLKKDLEDLGGVVETFLSKDVSYVVSDRPEVKLEYTKNAGLIVPSGASPAVSTPSPFQQGKDSTHGATDSPSASGEGMVTRGKAIVQKATISQNFFFQTYGTSNVLANAHNWNVNIRYIDSVIKYINKEKKKIKEAEVLSPKTGSQHNRVKPGTTKERKLSEPALKAEDASRHYRPSTQEMSSWPRLSMDGPSGSCPFDVTVSRDKHMNSPETHQPKGKQQRFDLSRNMRSPEAHPSRLGKQRLIEKEVTVTTPIQRSTARKATSHTPIRHKDTGVRDSRRGYCECCLTKYADLEKHLVSEQHRNFVRESNHYANLDVMIDEGPNMGQFLDDVMQNHEWQRLEGIRSMGTTDGVNLISSPSKLVNSGKDVCVQRHKTRQQNEETLDKDTAQSTSVISKRRPVQSKESAVHQSFPATNTLESVAHAATTSIAVHQENTVPVGNSDQHDGVCQALTPPRRSSRQRSTNLIIMSSTDASKQDEMLPSPQGEEKRLSSSRPTNIDSTQQSPATPGRKSSRLSLSARRRQLQKTRIGSPEITSPIEVTSKQDSQVSVNTLPTKDNRPKCLRLSLTARKRLLKESMNNKSLPVDGVEEASATPDPKTSQQETTTDVVQGVTNQPSTSIKPKQGGNNQGISQSQMNKTGASKTLSLRKRKLCDLHDSVSPKHINKTGINTDHKQHTQPDRYDRQESTKEQRRKKSKTRVTVVDSQESPCDSDCNIPDVSKCPVGKQTQGPAKQAPAPTSRQSMHHANFETIFQSDPNVEQSSFLGFSTNDITETEQRLQQLSASSLSYTDKLEEAALNVCCIPSSELCLPEQDDDSWSGSSDEDHVEEVFVGMALRNLANFPSDGSDWEAKVGGFMSVRLDKAMQVKKKETIMPQVGIQGKENIHGHLFRQDENMPDKIITSDMSRQLEQLPNTSQNIPRRKDETVSRKTERRSKPVDAEVPMKNHTINCVPSHKTKSIKQSTQASLSSGSVNVEKRINTHQHPTPLNGPCRVAFSNAVSVSSPGQSQKPVCSTPQQNKSQTTGKYQLVFSPDTPVDERQIILNHYVHDVSEEDIDFPKFSSPGQSDFIVSPIKNFTKNRSPNLKRGSRSSYKLKAPKALSDLSPRASSSKKSLFTKRPTKRRRRNSTPSQPGRVFHLHLNPPGSPRKRDVLPSGLSSPIKQSVANIKQSLHFQSGLEPTHPQFSYMPINEYNKTSPTFCAETKPHFSSHILDPGNKRRRSDRLRRHSHPQQTLQRPSRTWSLCVSFDDDICRSEDVYEFIDESTELETGNSSQQSKDGAVKRSNTPKKTASSKLRAPRDKACTSVQKSSEHSDDLVMKDYGLPFSFFM
ncbi:uncharacterized protein [Asterias amurensis]|uniref:uncharacterized protein isoform X1 n=1 Tax=Asterias amurensis TaxID=7602 RepID=UPI003AB8CFC1